MSARSTLGCWIEAMRLRTLPVSVSGVVFAAGICVAERSINVVALALCLIFALLAQVASNFANEYFDYRAGLDRVGRDGPRRGVTEGDIAPQDMLKATLATLAVACAVGCLVVALYGCRWMYIAGIFVAVGAMAYSTGPFPLSRHGLGEVAVVLFFGVVPVCLTCMLCGVEWSSRVLAAGIALGCMGANVLVVNNYRDRDDDLLVGKNTLAVIAGRPAMVALYFCNGLLALLLTIRLWLSISVTGWLPPAFYLLLHCGLTAALTKRSGRALNPLLGLTAMLMLLFSLTFLILSISTL
ncbi:MAG: 1,4-dihydroxy-2-naphthoate octaprenyltransferase [Duncaniella sp.]|nr:1,4-dihydroxy-2-naphthoate octaprenyltransferase [Duncaniella sp.]